MTNVVLQSTTSKIPKIRFAGFTDTWKENTLIGISKDGFSNGVFNDPLKVGSGYSLINVKDMYRGDEIDIETLTRVELSKNEFESNKANKGDIFFTRSSLVKEGIAYSNIFDADDENTTFDGHLIRMRPNNTVILSKFLAKLLKTHTLRRQLVSRGKTGTMTTIGQDDIATIKVLFPTIPEQQKIAHFFSYIDDWHNNLRNQKDLLEKYKKGMMQKIFLQEIRFKDKNGKAYPEWKEYSLGDVFYSEKGFGLSKDAVDEEGKYECVLYGELYTRYKEVILDVNSRTNSKIGLKSKTNDLLIPCSTTTTGIDLANVTALNKPDVLLGGDITVLRSEKNVYNIYFAYYFSNYKKKELAKYAQGSTIVHLYYTHFKKIQIDMPCYKEQQRIAYFLTSVDNIIETKQKQITEADIWKKALMQQMFV